MTTKEAFYNPKFQGLLTKDLTHVSHGHQKPKNRGRSHALPALPGLLSCLLWSFCRPGLNVQTGPSIMMLDRSQVNFYLPWFWPLSTREMQLLLKSYFGFWICFNFSKYQYFWVADTWSVGVCLGTFRWECHHIGISSVPSSNLFSVTKSSIYKTTYNRTNMAYPSALPLFYQGGDPRVGFCHTFPTS